MSQSAEKKKLPELHMDAQELEALRQRYPELIGFGPRAGQAQPGKN